MAEAGFGLYVHWPFCAAKCPYCDFNSHVGGSIDHTRWKAAFLSEIARLGGETGGRVLNSIFFGGGTPSLMAPDTVGAIIEAAEGIWRFANDVEITLEANPTSVEAGRFGGFRDAGVNRVSVGVQALNDDDLRRLGRLHSAAEARRAVDIAASTFERFSFDLIYARQDQTLANWRTELPQALDMADGHLSLYQLTIEPGTAFGDRLAAGRLDGLPDEDIQANLYAATQDICAAHGLPAYEVSNHARAGEESRHNLIYWRSGDWAAVGPGAHGRLTLSGRRFATETPRAPAAWLEQVEASGNGEVARRAISKSDQQDEFLMMGLRLAEGVRLADADPDYLLKINRLREIDVVELTQDGLRLTQRGRPLLNAVLRDLLGDQGSAGGP